jgi:hypothetical protein
VRPLGEKWRLSVKKVGEWFVKSWHLQGCSPRLCRLRIDGLDPASKYYGPGKPSSRPSTEGWLCPHCFIGWLGRETGYGPTVRSAVVLWIVSGALFLRSSGPAQLYWWLHKRLLCNDCMRYVWSGTIRGLSVGCMWRVGQVSPTGCTSIQIAATLGYE